MNVTNTNDTEYYEKLVLEIGILQEEIILPELPKEELSLPVLQEYASRGKNYNLMQNCYKNEIGKFYIPVLFPLVDIADGPEEFLHNAPKKGNIVGDIQGIQYTELNYIPLVIPKYIVMKFRDVIPKATKFLIGFSGEHKKISNLNVIGLYGAEL